MDCRPWWLSGLIQKRTREQGDYCHCDGPRRRQRKWKSLPGFAVWWCDGNRRMDWRESLEDEDRQGNGIHFRTSGGERSIRITPVKAPSCTLSLSLSQWDSSFCLRFVSRCAALLPSSRRDDNDGWTWHPLSHRIERRREARVIVWLRAPSFFYFYFI